MLAVIKSKKQLSEGNLKKGIYQDSCTDRHIRIEYLKNTEMRRDRCIQLTVSDNVTCAKIPHPRMLTVPLIMKPW